MTTKLPSNRWWIALAAAAAAPALFAQSITITPAKESVVINTTHQFTATVSGLSNRTLKWYVNGVEGGGGIHGSIDSNGLFKAPSKMPGEPNVTLKATSVSNPSISGTAIAVIRMPAPVLTSLSATSLPTGSFTLMLNGTGFQAGSIAYLSGTALNTTYISPTQLKATGAMYSQGQRFVQATNPSSVYSNYLTINFTSGSPGTPPPSGSVSVSPSSVSVAQGATQQFSALLNGAAQTATWAVTTPGGGSINSSGLYTAPAVIPNPPTATITATVSGKPAATATVTITSNVPPVITGISATPIPVGVFSFSINGQGFASTSTATFGGTPLIATYVSPTQLNVFGFAGQASASAIVVNNGAISSQPFAVQIGVSNPLVSTNAARRFLQQGAFGPTTADAAHVQQVGFQGWLTEQFAVPKSSNYANLGSQGGLSTRFLTNAVNQPDQLRQRVAFALSQIFVTSINKNIWNTIISPYEEMLMTDAFGNFRQILNDVTLFPAMGQFLDMANNAKGNTAGTILANENYAREVLQLFTIGTFWLNQDGTKQLDGMGNPMPTYSQSTISEFAKVFTGWTYAPVNPGAPVVWNAYINNTTSLMVPYQAMHDVTSKTLLSYSTPPGVYTTLAANQSAQTDLAQGLDNIFYHPNVPPFISKQLIQHLVKSNPSPAYIQRVATVFANNGLGVRGDMKAVIAAILTDAEARQNDLPGMTQTKDGHLQEPVLFMAGMLRAMGAQVNDQNYFAYDLTNMGQDVYNPPSVFNYFSPGYVVPGAGVGGPEFQIYTPYSSVYRDNVVSNMFGAYNNNINSYGPGAVIDLSPFVALAGTPTTLVDAIDLTLTAGLAPAGLKSILVNAVQAETGGNLRRVQTALYLLLSSGYYNVWN